MSIHITRHVEFDAGHRVPDHASKCRHPHGHRYRLDLTVTGEVHDERGNPEDGMVADFGVLADVLDKVASEYDHAFMVASYDTKLKDFIADEGWRLVVIDGPPTAEVLVKRMVKTIVGLLPAGVTVTEATLWETPKCRATFWS